MTHALKCGMAWQAVGDALGDPFEFQKQVNPEAVRQSIASNTKLYITDDSQLAYFSLRALRRKLENPSTDFRTIIQEEYLKWYATQLGEPSAAPEIPECFFYSCAPGIGTMRALGSLEAGDPVTNQARGCGSVMRILPFCAGVVDFSTGYEYCQQSAAVTHKHPDNVKAVDAYWDYAVAVQDDGYPSPHSIDYARILWAKDISQLGAGFYATEAVDMAIWVNMNASHGQDMLVKAIAHDGDSDSVAAIAGSLWGLKTGKMPPKALLGRVVEWPEIEKEIDRTLALVGN